MRRYSCDFDYDDGIQYVSVLPARKKSKIVEEVTLQTAAPAKHHGKKKKHRKEREPFDDMGMEERDYRPRYEDMDFEELTDYRKLYAYLKDRLVPEKMTYIFWMRYSTSRIFLK